MKQEKNGIIVKMNVLSPVFLNVDVIKLILSMALLVMKWKILTVFFYIKLHDFLKKSISNMVLMK